MLLMHRPQQVGGSNLSLCFGHPEWGWSLSAQSCWAVRVCAFIMPMPFPVHYLPASCHLRMYRCSYWDRR